MNVREKIQAVLIGAAGVTALVPAARIRVPGDWQNLTKPYIVHFPVAAESTYCHDGPKALVIWDFYQVSVYAADEKSAATIADAVVLALNGYRDSDTNRIAVVGRPKSLGYDTDLKVAHVAIDFNVAGALT